MKNRISRILVALVVVLIGLTPTALAQQLDKTHPVPAVETFHLSGYVTDAFDRSLSNAKEGAMVRIVDAYGQTIFYSACGPTEWNGCVGDGGAFFLAFEGVAGTYHVKVSAGDYLDYSREVKLPATKFLGQIAMTHKPAEVQMISVNIVPSAGGKLVARFRLRNVSDTKEPMCLRFSVNFSAPSLTSQWMTNGSEEGAQGACFDQESEELSASIYIPAEMQDGTLIFGEIQLGSWKDKWYDYGSYFFFSKKAVKYIGW